MKTSCIIIGQGIAGTCLAWQLRQRNIPFLVVDGDNLTSASAVSSGLINPITGRNYNLSWMMEELLVQAHAVYGSIEITTGKKYRRLKPIWRCLHNIAEENSWFSNRLRPDMNAYMGEEMDIKKYQSHLVFYEERLVEIHQGMSIDIASMLADVRAIFQNEGSLIETSFLFDQLSVRPDGVVWNDIYADHIIFAQGYQGISNPFFSSQEYRPALGEVAHVRIEEFPEDVILKYKKFFVPLSNGLVWVGSNYLHHRDLSDPFTDDLDIFLKEHVRTDYSIQHRQRGIRAATRHRRPMLGTHFEHKSLHIINGLGTKGISLAPFWTNHLIEHIFENMPISELVKFR